MNAWRQRAAATATGILFALLLDVPAPAQTVEIGVFSLFRPVQLRVTPASGPLLVTSGSARTMLEGRESYTIRLAHISSTVRVSARDGSPADFQLSIPGKIERRFHGILTVRRQGHQLVPVVIMDREVAVASVVAAEMTPWTPREALKAQAVAARSYYAAAGRRHDGFDFCDSTHCQFLREWPEPSGAAFQATRSTRGLLLAYQGKPFAALYSASCGGRTRALEAVDAGSGPGAYPYYSVPCDFCRRHAPGVIQGHQLGLCQAGAAGMAAAGADFREILEHYYPATSLIEVETNAIFLLPLPPALRHSKDE